MPDNIYNTITLTEVLKQGKIVLNLDSDPQVDGFEASIGCIGKYTPTGYSRSQLYYKWGSDNTNWEKLVFESEISELINGENLRVKNGKWYMAEYNEAGTTLQGWREFWLVNGSPVTGNLKPPNFIS